MKLIPIFIFLLFSLTFISASSVIPISGSTQKICQLIGDTDKQFNTPTLSQTATRFGVLGTDLGVSFEHGGKLIFLFGDTFGTAYNGFSGNDAFAYTTDRNPDSCINLNFFSGPNGKYLPPKVSGISQGAFEVPMEGVDINGQAYVFFTTDHTATKTMGKSVVAKMNSDETFSYLYDFSDDKFINVHVVKIDNSQFSYLSSSGNVIKVSSGQLAGLPSNENGLLIFGSGDYRKSNLYLAFIPENSLEDKSQLKYFTGLNKNGNPQWSSSESDAVALFNDPVIGEFSVQYNSYLNKWIVLYGGVTMRSSDLPWEKWSDAQILFNAAQDGYCKFIHKPNCDSLSEPILESTWGGAYGPYLIDEYTTGNSKSSTIYYTLSTWNPYTVVLMKSEIQLKDGGVIVNPPTTNWKPRPLIIILFLVVLIVIIVVLVRSLKKK